jgi:hypothetical protein
MITKQPFSTTEWTFFMSRIIAQCGLSDGVLLNDRRIKMPNLVSMEKFRLCSVSDNHDENGLYSLVRLDNNDFNKVIVDSEIEGTLTDLTQDFYGQDDDCQWYEITGDVCKHGVVGIDLDDDGRCLVISSIIDQIDVGEGFYRFFVIVNGLRTEFRWIAAVSLGTVYMDGRCSALQRILNQDD